MFNFLGPIVKDNFDILIRFSLDSGAPNSDLVLWDSICHKLFPSLNGVNNSLSITKDDIFNKWKENCSLDSNRELPLLDWYDGGLGGGNTRFNKHIRPIRIINPYSEAREYFKAEIIMSLADSTDEVNGEKWTLEEVQDLLKAFVKTCNDYLSSYDVCRAQIVLEYRN